MAARRPMTQRMIAERVGVSVATVSRVLRQDESEAQRWASPETVAAIRLAAQAGGYHPNPHAASLRTARSDVVGVLVPRLQDFVLATVYEGIEEAAAERSISTFVTNSFDRPELRRIRTQTMLDRRVDGMIFGDARMEDDYLAELARLDVPFVLASRRSGPHISITCDDHLGGRLVAQHLLAQGRRDVAVLAGQPYASTGVERTRGLVDTFAEAGIEVPAHRIATGGFDADGGREGAEKLFSERPYPDAVFATNDFAAFGAMGVLRDKGLSIPDDVALVGYNDTPLAESVTISLTTVRSPMHQMGRLAMETLLDRLAGKSVKSQLLAPELIIRGSTTGR